MRSQNYDVSKIWSAFFSWYFEEEKNQVFTMACLVNKLVWEVALHKQQTRCGSLKKFFFFDD